MIIGENFIWLHFPKCAGTFTETLLRQHVVDDMRIKFDPIDPENIIWHQNVSKREEATKVDLSSKEIICNFRRLPSWIISRVVYEEKRSGNVAPKDLYSIGNFLKANGGMSNADTTLKRYTSRKVNHWIRVEHLEGDFTNVFSKFIKFTPPLDSSFFQKRVNTSDWGNDIQHWFSPDELKKLYNACPLWSEYEREIYGNLLID
jgi:hypothetical protein